MYGHPRAVGGGERSDVARLHDAGGAAGELREQRALLDEILEQLSRAILGRDFHQDLEALDGDRLLPDLVLARYTMPKPPSPTTFSISYFSPIVVPTMLSGSKCSISSRTLS